MGVSDAPRLCAAALAALLLGCGSAEPGETPVPLPLRIACRVQRWIEGEELRLRQETVDRCGEAGRALREGERTAREVLRDSVEPPEPGEDPASDPP